MTDERFDPDESHRHRVYGKHRGTVVEGDGDDGGGGPGHVWVTVPAVFGTDVKVLARPCFTSGHFFVPPAGAGVWVEFEAGDPGYPLWVGTWYPPEDVPPEAAGAGHAHRVVHSPSGHALALEDTEGAERVVLRHRSDTFLSVDEHGSALLANHKGAHLHLDADAGAVSLTSQHGHTVSMTAAGVIVAAKDGKTVVTVEGDRVTIAGGAQLSLVADSIAVSGGSVSLGSGAVQHALLDSHAVWGALLAHVHPTPGSPPAPVVALPPVPPPPTHSVTSVTAG